MSYQSHGLIYAEKFCELVHFHSLVHCMGKSNVVHILVWHGDVYMYFSFSRYSSICKL